MHSTNAIARLLPSCVLSGSDSIASQGSLLSSCLSSQLVHHLQKVLTTIQYLGPPCHLVKQASKQARKQASFHSFSAFTHQEKPWLRPAAGPPPPAGHTVPAQPLASPVPQHETNLLNYTRRRRRLLLSQQLRLQARNLPLELPQHGILGIFIDAWLVGMA
ncbi:MAG: hypothetical protein FRX49_09853 [Trebouxia sp. A1-2]|nr:MAG: hypothetical protein FRX49_09853 [Trebouxia sp. A1-2]